MFWCIHVDIECNSCMHVGINEFGVEFMVNWCMHVHVYDKSMISSYFEKNWLLRASNWSFELI